MPRWSPIDPLPSAQIASKSSTYLGDRDCLRQLSAQARSNLLSNPEQQTSSRRHKAVVLARLAGSAEISRAGAQEAMVDAIALEMHELAAGRI